MEALSKTCNSLQSQVEQLQSSLMGVMQFMSNFQDHPNAGSGRHRHSSNESSSVSFFQMTQSVGKIVSLQYSNCTEDNILIFISIGAEGERPKAGLKFFFRQKYLSPGTLSTFLYYFEHSFHIFFSQNLISGPLALIRHIF